MRAVLIAGLAWGLASCTAQLSGPPPPAEGGAILIFSGEEVFAVDPSAPKRLALSDPGAAIYAALFDEPLVALDLPPGPVQSNPLGVMPLEPAQVLKAESPEAPDAWLPTDERPELMRSFRVHEIGETWTVQPPSSRTFTRRILEHQTLLYRLELSAPAIILARVCGARLDLLDSQAQRRAEAPRREGCTTLSGLALPAARVDPGTYYLRLIGQSPQETQLEVELRAKDTWGNGLREGREECDDGNVQSRDGCSTTSEIEADLVLEGPPVIGLYSGVIRPVGDRDAFRLNVTQTSSLIAEASTQLSAPCASPTRIRLYDVERRELASDEGTCNRLSGLENPAARLERGVYYVEVEDADNDDEISAYDLRLELR